MPKPMYLLTYHKRMGVSSVIVLLFMRQESDKRFFIDPRNVLH